MRSLQRAPALCLCLWLTGASYVVPQSGLGQGHSTGAQKRPAELEEAEKLNGQVIELYRAGRYEEAVPAAERALAIFEKAMGPEHPDAAAAANNLALVYDAKGDYAKAEPLYLRSLAFLEKTFGPEHAEVAYTLNALATLYRQTSDYAKAERSYQRSLAIYEKAHGPEHADVATVLNNLAGLYRETGDYVKAEPLYLRSLSIREKALGPEHLDVGTSLNNLALLYDAKGDYAKAEPLYLRGLAVTEKALGPGHPDVAISLNNLGLLYRELGDDAKAEAHYLRALAIFEKAFSRDDTRTANTVNNLSALYYKRGDYAKAEQFLLRSLSAREKTLGPEHPAVAQSLNNLALVYKDVGDFAKSESLYLRALGIFEKALGPEHPRVAASLNNIASLYEAKGDYARAVQFNLRAEEVRERNLSLILSTGSERQKLAYLSTIEGETDATVSLHARSAPSDPQALRLALTTVLRRKGRALDAMSDQVGALRRRLDERDRELLERLSSAQSQLSALVLEGPGISTAQEHDSAVSRLRAEIERLQDAVARRSSEFRALAQPVTVERVRAALPEGAALVEFYSYAPFDARAKGEAQRFGPPRYVAYVLGGEGEPRFVDLGEAEAIDAGVMLLRAALKDPSVKDLEGRARALDERVMRPVRKLLGDTRQVFLSPDGALNLAPFAALVDENGKYLVETYSLAYVTSGRDLLRLRERGESRQPPLVVADPLFDSAQGASAGSTPGGAGHEGRRAADLGGMRFGRLPGTAEEAKVLGALLPGARVLTQANATESALKRASGPRVLHVATHGFFLPDRAGGESQGDSAESMLLRAGLALEGANGRQGARGEDGILTALEAAALDLWGTKLVVLSACETGIGEVKNGDGVYGLRRALVLAGSESQVMSLWKVSDEATRDLMVAYHKRLQAGVGRTDALRQVQLEMLRGAVRTAGGSQRGLGDKLAKKADRSHPYFWAAFIQSGDWRPIAGQPTPAK